MTTMLEFQPGSLPRHIYSHGTSATLNGRDSRKESTVVHYQLGGRVEEKIDNLTAPHILIEEQLEKGYIEQGLLISGNSPVHIEFDLKELLVSVTRVKLLYRAKARSRLIVTIKHEGVTLTRSFDRETSRDSLTRPQVGHLELLLEEQLADIVYQILGDQQVQNTIKGPGIR